MNNAFINCKIYHRSTIIWEGEGLHSKYLIITCCKTDLIIRLYIYIYIYINSQSLEKI